MQRYYIFSPAVVAEGSTPTPDCCPAEASSYGAREYLKKENLEVFFLKTPKKSLRVGPIDEKKNTSFLQVFFLISKSAEKTLFSFHSRSVEKNAYFLMEYHFQRDKCRIHIRKQRHHTTWITNSCLKLTPVVLLLIGVTTKVKCGKTLTQLIRQKPMARAPCHIIVAKSVFFALLKSSSATCRHNLYDPISSIVNTSVSSI